MAPSGGRSQKAHETKALQPNRPQGDTRGTSACFKKRHPHPPLRATSPARQTAASTLGCSARMTWAMWWTPTSTCNRTKTWRPTRTRRAAQRYVYISDVRDVLDGQNPPGSSVTCPLLLRTAVQSGRTASCCATSPIQLTAPWIRKTSPATVHVSAHKHIMTTTNQSSN